MAQHIIGIGGWKVSADPEDSIKTYALGSCVGVLVYDRVARIGGLIHIALPSSSVNPERAGDLPGYFADTGLPLVLGEFARMGAMRRYMWIKIAGGARILDPDGVFDIGKRNILAVKRILWANHFGVVAENTGGDVSRTVTIHIASGEVDVAYHSQNKEKQGGERSWISGTCS